MNSITACGHIFHSPPRIVPEPAFCLPEAVSPLAGASIAGSRFLYAAGFRIAPALLHKDTDHG